MGQGGCFEPGRGTTVIPSEKWQSSSVPNLRDWARDEGPLPVASKPDSLHRTGARCVSGRPSQTWVLQGPGTISRWTALCSLLSLSGAWEALGSLLFSLFRPASWRFHWYRPGAQPCRPNPTLCQPCPTGVASPLHNLPADPLHWLQFYQLISSTPLCQFTQWPE